MSQITPLNSFMTTREGALLPGVSSRTAQISVDINVFAKPVPFNEMKLLVRNIVERREAYI